MPIITRNTPEGQEFSGNLKTLTEDRVCAFSGGFPKGARWPNKNIHTDPQSARACGLPAPAASGSMSEAYLTELMVDLFGVGWLTGGRMQLVFIRMVEIGDGITARATVHSRQDEGSSLRFVLDVWCENQHGVKVVVGTATGLLQ